MPSNSTLPTLALVALTVAFAGGCKQRTPNDHTEAATAELRSADAPVEVRAGESNAYLATVRREQLALRTRLRERIDALDSQLAALRVDAPGESGSFVDPHAKNAGRIRALIDQRTQLEVDLAAVDRADERGWDDVKASIEHDLGRTDAPREAR